MSPNGAKPTGAGTLRRPAPGERRVRSSPNWSRRRTPPRRRLAVAAVLGLGLLGLAGWAGVALNAAHAHLLAARAALSEAQGIVPDGNIEAAAAAMGEAQRAFASAEDELGRPPVRLLGAMPFAGRSVVTARALARSGREITEAGVDLMAAVEKLPGGPDAFAPRAGAIPLKPIDAIAPAFADAAEHIAASVERVEQSPRTLLVAQVAEARWEFLDSARPLTEGLQSAAVVAEVLPSFLGAEEPRRYFFGGQNPAESRGTGGLIGAWAEVEIRNGRLEFTEFANISTLTLTGDDAPDLPAPNPDYERRWGRFAASRHASNINMSPDFPSVAEAILNLHEYHNGKRLDGVILADPFVFEAMLALTGSVEVPEVGEIDADGVVRFLSVEQYELFPEDSPRKPVLGEIAEVTIQRLLTGEGTTDPARIISALARPAGAGRLLLYSTDEREQVAFSQVPAGGSFTYEGGDPAIAVVINNAAGSKADYFIEQELDFEVRLGADGSAWTSVTLRLQNNAPTTGYERPVIGPYREGMVAGLNRFHLSLYCAPNCRLVRFQRDGERAGMTVERELGWTVHSSWEDVHSGERLELRYEWQQGDAWEPVSDQYALRAVAQPVTDPPHTSAKIIPPDGRRVAPWGAPSGPSGGRLQPDGLVQLDRTRLYLADVLPRGHWASLRDRLSRPLIGLGD